MAGSLNGARYFELMTTGNITAAELDAELADAKRFGEYQLIYTFDDLFDELTTNEYVQQLLVDSSRALGHILNTAALRTVFLADTVFLTALEANVNVGGKFIKRDTVTATGTWTYPTDGIEAIFVTAVGPGGDGGDATSTHGGTGGSGGAIVGEAIERSLVTANVSVTIPTTSGTPTTFGSLVSAASGTDGTTATGNTGAGTATDITNIVNADPDASAFQAGSFVFQGGDGGDRNSSNGDGTDGTVGITGVGGAGSVADTSASVGGTGIGSGGGGGGDNTASHSAFTTGGSTSDPGCGGGGGSDDGTTPGSGGTGGDGKVWVYYVQGRP